MPAFIFDECCGCVDLKKGCFIIGYLQLVGDIFLIIASIILLVMGGIAMNNPAPENQQIGAELLVLGSILLVLVSLLLAFTIVLLLGLHKNRRKFVKAYLIYSSVFLVFGVVSFVSSLVQVQSINAGNITTNIIGLVIQGYFFLIIRSYYYKMDEFDQPPYRHF